MIFIFMNVTSQLGKENKVDKKKYKKLDSTSGGLEGLGKTGATEGWLGFTVLRQLLQVDAVCF